MIPYEKSINMSLFFHINIQSQQRKQNTNSLFTFSYLHIEWHETSNHNLITIPKCICKIHYAILLNLFFLFLDLLTAITSNVSFFLNICHALVYQLILKFFFYRQFSCKRCSYSSKCWKTFFFIYFLNFSLFLSSILILNAVLFIRDERFVQFNVFK